MILNEEKAKKFLAQNNIANCTIKKIAGDASFRSYYRIFCEQENFILMFAPPSHEDIQPFIKIDKFLIENNFSAPNIFAIDVGEGFMLLEDFGDDSYSRVLAQNIDAEFNLYKNAADCLIEVHKAAPIKDIELYNNAILLREVMLFVDWYLPHVKKIEINLQDKARFKVAWFQLFDLIDRENPILVLRDYHADNLMLIKNRAGYKSVGLLDFQDALLGSRAYDLVSLLEDARRDVAEKTRQEIFQYYVFATKIDQKSFARDYAILSLQRNIKIIGIFSRLAKRDCKPHYLNLLPRVIDLVKMRLASNDPIFFDISDLLQKFI